MTKSIKEYLKNPQIGDQLEVGGTMGFFCDIKRIDTDRIYTEFENISFCRKTGAFDPTANSTIRIVYVKRPGEAGGVAAHWVEDEYADEEAVESPFRPETYTLYRVFEPRWDDSVTPIKHHEYPIAEGEELTAGELFCRCLNNLTNPGKLNQIKDLDKMWGAFQKGETQVDDFVEGLKQYLFQYQGKERNRYREEYPVCCGLVPIGLIKWFRDETEFNSLSEEDKKVAEDCYLYQRLKAAVVKYELRDDFLYALRRHKESVDFLVKYGCYFDNDQFSQVFDLIEHSKDEMEKKKWDNATLVFWDSGKQVRDYHLSRVDLAEIINCFYSSSYYKFLSIYRELSKGFVVSGLKKEVKNG